MKVVARKLTLEEDGIPGYVAHPEGSGLRPGVMMVHHAHGVTADYKIDAYRLAALGFNVLVPSLFNMFGVPGTNHIGQGADLQAKHSDSEFLVKMDEAWHYLTERLKSDPARTACIGHCLGGRLLIPFAADHPQVRAIVLYYPSVRDEPETSHRPRHAFTLARTLKCASLVFCAGKDYIATPAIPTMTASSPTTPTSPGRSSRASWSARCDPSCGPVTGASGSRSATRSG